MKRSIRKRIAACFIILMVAALAAIGIINLFLADDYYLRDKQNTLVKSFEMINTSSDKDSLDHYCEVNTLIYVIADESLEMIATNVDEGDQIVGHLFGTLLDMEEDTTSIIKETDSYRIAQYTNRGRDREYLELWGTLDNGNYYIVLCPVESVQLMSGLTARFYVIICLFTVAVSIIVILTITKSLTKPVEELTEISEKMANLEFEAKYTSGGEDEIGRLGENFNLMSEKLEQTISELKSANAQLEKDVEEKNRIDEMRREFISNVSHELKTPIALIQGYAEGLKEMELDKESQDMYCDVIADEAKKMNKLVMQLINLNAIESGADQLEFKRFNLTELIRGILSSSSIMLESNNAKVVFDETEPIAVWGDEFKIEEVITNYLTNAIHHLDGERIIRISCAKKGDIVETTVFNTGSPIPEESMDQLWTKFYKVDKARTRDYGGSGIGLSIVKAIMDAHGQTCKAVNYSNGVAFSFNLALK